MNMRYTFHTLSCIFDLPDSLNIINKFNDREFHSLLKEMMIQFLYLLRIPIVNISLKNNLSVRTIHLQINLPLFISMQAVCIRILTAFMHIYFH